MKKSISLLCTALVCTFSLNAKTIYLVPNGNWKQADAKFSANYFGGEGITPSFTDFMTTTDGIHYETTVPDAAQTIIFVRHNPAATTPGWDSKWNQTSDLAVSADNNCYTIAEGAWDKGEGTWSTYTPSVETPTYYITGNDKLVGAELAWKSDAIELGKATAETPATHRFTNLAAGDTLRMKITNGTWDLNFGYTALDKDCSSDNILNDNDNNVVFVLTAPGDVLLTFDGSRICLTGSFAAPCTDDYGIMVGTTYIAAVINTENTAEYMLLGVDLKQGDTFTLYNNCAQQAWVMETIKDGSTANITIAEGKYLVGETGKYDFYFTLNPDAIYMAYTIPSGVCNTYTPATDAPLYNLLGVQVDNTYRGIVIQSGHKFLLQ